MKREEIKLGMKVVPINKSVAFGTVGLEHCYSWRKAKELGQPYLFVAGTDIDDLCVILCSAYFSDIELGIGDFFLPEDLIPYKE